MRNRYYKDCAHLKTIMEEFDVKKGTAINAIKGNGAFYSSIEDGIPEEVKMSRVRYDHKYSIAQMKRNTTNPHTYNKRKREKWNTLG